jgi:DNA-binding transcriptional ArsR family regulator
LFPTDVCEIVSRRAADELFELLGNELAREILVQTSDDSHSASELAGRCEVSKPTVYRRLEELERHELVEKEARYDADGNHYAAYACRVEGMTFGIDDDGVTVELDRRSSVVDDG